MLFAGERNSLWDETPAVNRTEKTPPRRRKSSSRGTRASEAFTSSNNNKGLGTFGRQVSLLLWKNWIIHHERFVAIFFELLVPPFVCALLMALRFSFPHVPVAPTTTTTADAAAPHSLARYSTGNRTVSVLGYAPSGVDDVREVMSFMRDWYVKESPNEALILKDFVNEEAMEKYAMYSTDIFMCISFLNVGANRSAEVPKNARFSIRPPTTERLGSWHSKEKIVSANDLSQHRNNRYLTSGVLFIQRLLGESLIKYWRQKAGAVDANLSQFDVYSQRMVSEHYHQDRIVEFVEYFLPIAIHMTLIFSVILNTKELANEKERKLKEVMKLMGLLPSAHWASWFLSFCLFQLPMILQFSICLAVPIDGNCPVLCHSNPFLVFVFLLVYGLSTIAFSFMIASIFHKAHTASVAAGVLFVAIFVPSVAFDLNSHLSKWQMYIMCLSCNITMTNGIKIICLHERTGAGLQLDNFMLVPDVSDDFSMLEMVLALFVDIVLYFNVSWYVDNVRPGQFGMPRPLNFCFKRSYWFGTADFHKSVAHRMRASSRKSMIRFEKEPTTLKAGIQINGLTKVFGKKTAVDRIYLNMYQGQITALLGHNGAGKTTILSMLTGFTPPSYGTATVNDFDIRKNIAQVRNSMGLCPESDILFDVLTVKQHLVFFAGLKETTKRKAQRILPLLREVGLNSKAGEKAKRLSAGQRKKLSIAIALVAGPQVLILDEPMAGLDPNARRQVCELLKKYKAGRTVLLTTHSMHVADNLGDRIAIMADGVLKCCGSSLFLKNMYGKSGYWVELSNAITEDEIGGARWTLGTGYRLVLVTEPQCRTGIITEIVKSHVTTARLKGKLNQELIYSLPPDEKYKFSDMFIELEKKQRWLGICSFGTSTSRMEEVFLTIAESSHHHQSYIDRSGEKSESVAPQSSILDISMTSSDTEDADLRCSNVDRTRHRYKSSTSVDQHEMINIPPSQDLEGEFNPDFKVLTKKYERPTDVHLALSRFGGILTKKALLSWRNGVMTAMQVLLPVVTVALCLGLPSFKEIHDPPLTLDLGLYDRTIVPATHVQDATNQSQRLHELYSDVFPGGHYVLYLPLDELETYEDTTRRLMSEMTIEEFNKQVVVGFEDASSPNDQRMTLISHYNAHYWHAEPIGVLYLMNAIVRFHLNESYSIHGILHPLSMNYLESANAFIDHTRRKVLIPSTFTSLGMAFIMSMFAYLYLKERTNGAKTLQTINGASPLVYWLPSFLWDYLIYLVPVSGIVVLYHAAGVTSQGCVAAFLLLSFHGLAALPYTYAAQFLFQTPATGVGAILCWNIFTGKVCLLVLGLLMHVEKLIPTFSRAVALVDTVFQMVFPCYTVGEGIKDIFQNDIYLEHCKDVRCSPSLPPHPCCKDHCSGACFQYQSSYLAMTAPGIGTKNLIFVVAGISYFLIVFTIEHRLLQRIASRLLGNSLPLDGLQEVSEFGDSDLGKECERIQESTPEELNKTDGLVIRNLYTVYGDLVVVNNLCLGVRKKECIGLLGPNGAGKTSVFKVLIGEVPIAGGSAFLDGYSVHDDLKKAHPNMGYCPQYNALINKMTGRETLTMVARLKGVPKKHQREVVNNLIHYLILAEDADFLVSRYSWGSKRKLCMAVALVGAPDFLLLDEPTVGMDPEARRHLRYLLYQIREQGHTILLASHHMEELEALCTRLAIVVNGRLTCLGSPQHIKDKFAKGYTLNVHTGQQVIDGTERNDLTLVDYVMANMPSASVCGDHLGYVQFQISDPNVKLSFVFGLMEDVRERFHIDDYSVHQASLEQVFLSFADSTMTP